MSGQPRGAHPAGGEPRWQSDNRRGSRRRPATAPRIGVGVSAVAVGLTLCIVFGAYVAAANVLAANFGGDATITRSERDAAYFALHGVVLVAGTVVAVILAAFLRRSRWATGLLFLALLFLAMGFTQVITFQLACDGRNDIIRHWQCEP